MAEDIDFKYPMKKACAWEITSFCKNVPQGHARVIRCVPCDLAGLGPVWVGGGDVCALAQRWHWTHQHTPRQEPR